MVCYVCGSKAAAPSPGVSRPWDDEQHDLLICPACGASAYADVQLFFAAHTPNYRPDIAKQLVGLNVGFIPPTPTLQ